MTTIFLSVTCDNVTMLTNNYYNDFFELGQQKINFRSADKVYKEFMLYAIGRNINKYYRFLYEKLKKFEGKTA